MPRAIVYEPTEVQAEYADLVKQQEETGQRISLAERRSALADARVQAANTEPPPTAPITDGALPGKDDFLAKIAKYVPAETITLTTLAFAAISPSGNGVWVVAAAGVVANLLYLFSTALASPTTPLPRWYFYVLSVVAYAFWAAAIIGPIGEKVGIKGTNAETKQTFALALAAFVVPALDSLGANLPSHLKKNRPANKQKPVQHVPGAKI